MILQGDAAIENWRWPHYGPSEMTCHCGCGVLLIDEAHMNSLECLRAKCNFPLVVSSGYRCPAYNLKVAHTGEKGPHTTGKATDFSILGEQAALLVRFAMSLDLTSCANAVPIMGLGISQREGVGRFVHLDSLTEADGYPRPRVWGY